jgi:cobyrinic acid a,c-diamide synthase
VFLPGGYPELHAGRLAGNARFFAGLKAAATRGALVYGECGGYMVLGRGLVDAEGHRHAMAGLLPNETSFAERRLALGYRRIAHASPLPFPRRLRGHEFHYSTEAGAADAPLFTASDASGSDLGGFGSLSGRVMGSWLHLVDAEA